MDLKMTQVITWKEKNSGFCVTEKCLLQSTVVSNGGQYFKRENR